MALTHAEIVAMKNSGEVAIGVDRALAPHFYTRFLSREFAAVADDVAAVEGFLVWLGLMLGHLGLVGSVILSFVAFGWFGIVALMVCPIMFGVFVSASKLRDAGMTGVTLVLGVAIAIHLWGGFANHWATLFAIGLVASFWSIRFAYCVASSLLRCLVVRNERAFHFLLERSVIHIRFRETGRTTDLRVPRNDSESGV